MNLVDLKLNNFHDLELDAGDLALHSDPDQAVLQRIRIRLLTLKGELYRNKLIGMPYFDQVFEKGATLSQIRVIFTRAILATPGVASLNNIELSPDTATRQLSVTFEVVTERQTVVVTDKPFVIG